MGSTGELTKEKKKIGFTATREIAHCHQPDTMWYSWSSCVADLLSRQLAKAVLLLSRMLRLNLD